MSVDPKKFGRSVYDDLSAITGAMSKEDVHECRMRYIEHKLADMYKMLSSIQDFLDHSREHWVDEEGKPRSKYCKACIE